MKLPNLTSPLYRVGEHNTLKFSFSFSKLRYGPLGFNSRKFRQHLTNKVTLNNFDEVLKSAKSLFKLRFLFVVIQKFCYQATWRNDFSRVETTRPTSVICVPRPTPICLANICPLQEMYRGVILRVLLFLLVFAGVWETGWVSKKVPLRL